MNRHLNTHLNTHLNIALCFDIVRPNYLAHVLTTMVSLFESNKSNSLRIYVISRVLGDDAKAEIESLAEKYAQELIFIGEFDAVHADLIDRFYREYCNWSKNRDPDRPPAFPMATYYRLLLPFLVPEERVLYLDAGDIVVRRNLAEFYNTEFGDNLICGVRDLWESEILKQRPALEDEDFRAFRSTWPRLQQKAGTTGFDMYINTGVALWNLHAFNLAEYESELKRLADFVHSKGLGALDADQYLSNLLFCRRTKSVHKKHNFLIDYDAANIRIRTQDACILHYADEAHKAPPLFNTRRHYDLYYKYLDMTSCAGFRPEYSLTLKHALKSWPYMYYVKKLAKKALRL